MNIITFITAWVISILGMTAFSAAWSYFSTHQFREPQILAKILNKHTTKSKSDNNYVLLGWVIHIFIGAIFLGIYELLWLVTGVERTILWSLVFGTILGVFGILGWKVMFRFTNFSTNFKYTQYYIQLYFAHLVFSILALAVYKWFN